MAVNGSVLNEFLFKKAEAIFPADLFHVRYMQEMKPVYWTARKSVCLPGKIEKSEFFVAADRHYYLYVNGALVANVRNFFNGDQYVYAQECGQKVLPYLREGENWIEFVIRSDPWQNKNHRCSISPFLMAEGYFNGGDKTIEIYTDSGWSAAIVENWRQMISFCGCGTIISEQIQLFPIKEAVLLGFSKKLQYKEPKTLKLNRDLKIFLWNDFPIRYDLYKADKIASKGAYVFAQEAIGLPIRHFEEYSKKHEPLIIEAEFKEDSIKNFSIAASALLSYTIEFNNQIICQRDNTPDEYQMALEDYLVPAGSSCTIKGKNKIKIAITHRPTWMPPDEFRFATDLQSLRDCAEWFIEKNRRLVPQKHTLSIYDKIGAKLPLMKACSILSKKEGTIVYRPDKSQKNVSSIILDFGLTTQGILSFHIASKSCGKIYLGYGFTCHKGNLDIRRMNLNAADIIHVPEGVSQYRSFETKTFRYLELVFEGFNDEVLVSDILMEEPVFVDDRKSIFVCGDKKIDSLFKASRRTAQLCSDELYVDNPEREHAQWADPVYHCSNAGYYLFGEYRKAQKALEEIAMSQAPDGQIPGYAPGLWFPRVPLQCHMCLFALSFYNYYMQTGNTLFGHRMLTVVLKMIEHWEKYRNKYGLLCDLNTVFVDWGYCRYSYRKGENAKTGALTAMNAYYLGVLKTYATMARFLEKDDIEKQLLKKALEVEQAMRSFLYDDKEGVFIDGIDNPEAERTVSQPANCLAVQYGAAPAGQEEKILRKIFNWKQITRFEFLPSNALFAPKAAEALFENRCEDLALNWIGEKFGAMLDWGSDTLWETWQNSSSLCQGTAAGIGYLLARYVAGLYPKEPGYKIIGFEPKMPHPLKSLKAALTTPFGAIELDLVKHGAEISGVVKLPDALRTRNLHLSDNAKIQIDSKIIEDGGKCDG